MEETADATTQWQQPAAPIPPPPSSHRRARLRVREVSSRFMSPLVASNTNPTPTRTPAVAEPQHSKSVQRRQPQQQQHELEPCSIDENFIPETSRSLDRSSTPMALGGAHYHSSKSSSSVHRKQQQQQQQRVKPLNKENDAGGTLAKAELQQPRIGRPDTPIVPGGDRDRITPSRYRLASESLHRPSSYASNCINGGGDVSVTATTAAKLLQEATLTDPLTSSNFTAVRIQNNINNRMMPPTLSDLRSSMPEVDVLPTLSTRWQHVARSLSNFPVSKINNYDINSLKSTTTPCPRSRTNLPQLNSENSSSSSSFSSSSSSSSSGLCLRAGGDLTAASTPSKTSLKNQVASLCLPPHPSSLKPGLADARKGKKLFNHQEDVKHTLKLLYNHYLQWQFANAKSEVSMLAQKMEAERQLYSLGRKISEMREVVKNKHIELEGLQRIKTLSTIVESQMSYLDEWSAVSEDYSHSLSGVTDALLNLSLRLPVSGGVKVDVTELKETLDSAVKVIEMIAFTIQSFMVKAKGMESLVSELAGIMGGERAHIQECGYSLLKAYASQVEECSLRGHLIQLLGPENCRSHQQQKNYSQAPLRAHV